MAHEVLAREFLRAWNAHDADAAVQIMTEDCLFEPSVGPYPWGHRFHGRSEVKTWALETFFEIPDLCWDPIRCLFGEDHIVFEFRVTGTPSGGAPFDLHACDILTLRGGMIAAKRAYRKAPP
jgi:taurine dehydrogenase small subunit